MKRLFVLIPLCLILFTEYALALEKRSSKKECALCHILWLEAFARGENTLWEEKDTAIIVSGSKSAVTTREMCYSCHDGYVADSRMWIAEGNKHHDLKKVPEGLALPKDFRLDMNNDFYCGTCHGFHDVTAEGKIGEVPFVRLPNERSQMCLACHKGQIEFQKQKNHPVMVKLKTAPPPGLTKRRAKFGPEGEVLCQSCHASHAREPSIVTVEDSRLCLFCHADKQNTGSVLDRGRGLHPVNIKPDRDLRKAGVLPEQAKLGAGGKLICATCHSTHKGKSLSLLVNQDASTFCQGCHKKEQEAVSGTKHNLLKTAAKSKNVRGESPGQSGVCRTCHLAHGWAQKVLEGSDPISGACLSCHRANGWAEKEQVGHFSHPVDVAMPAGDVKSDLPMWSRKGERIVVCSTCHDAHDYWPGPENQSQALDIDGDPTNSFLRMQGRTLCEQCHPDQGLLQNTKHDLRRFEKPLDEAVAEPLALGGPCMGCHRAHNAQGKMLWFRSLPDETGEFDRDEATKRCLSCHADESMKRIEEKRGHPVGKEIPAESMPQPPDSLKLGKSLKENGKADILICTTCHLPHGGKNPAGAVTLFAGGGFQKQELCITCHREKGRIIGSPHDFRTRKAHQYIPDKGRSLEFGACAGCHVNHNSQMEKKLLWFKIPMPAGKGNPEDMLCLFCHGDPKVMGERRTKFYVHPRGTEIQQILAEKREKDEIPLVVGMQEFEGVSLFGYETIFAIRCVTCHDNHRWMAAQESKDGTSFVNTEMTSFLKGSIVAQKFCSRCHGIEALYRYRFFHQDRIFQRMVPNE